MSNQLTEKSLIFFDLESTGLNIVLDRIVQIGAIKVFPDGTKEVKEILINPGMAIPRESVEIHGITDETVKDKPVFKQLAKAMHDWFKDCDLGGHNICGFDIPLLAEEFARCGITFPDDSVNFADTLKIERIVNAHNLEECYKRYTGDEMGDAAHDALADTKASLEVFYAQKEEHNLPDDLHELEVIANHDLERVDFAGKLKRNDKGQICYAFGNSNGNPVMEDQGFGNWILGKDFPTDTKNWIRRIFRGESF